MMLQTELERLLNNHSLMSYVFPSLSSAGRILASQGLLFFRAGDAKRIFRQGHDAAMGDRAVAPYADTETGLIDFFQRGLQFGEFGPG